MDFLSLSLQRQSCRSFDTARDVEDDKLDYILRCAATAPSACNAQPYHITVCRGNLAAQVGRATADAKFNRFAQDAPIIAIISERPYNKSAALGAALKKNDYRSMDIGILASYITSAAADVGLGSCIIGWFDEQRLHTLINADGTVRLAIALGYPTNGEVREKRRISLDELVTRLP